MSMLQKVSESARSRFGLHLASVDIIGHGAGGLGDFLRLACP